MREIDRGAVEHAQRQLEAAREAYRAETARYVRAWWQGDINSESGPIEALTGDALERLNELRDDERAKEDALRDLVETEERPRGA